MCRMPKYVLLLFLTPLFLVSCGYDVENNRRIVFTGNLIDDAQNPIPNTLVYLEGRDFVGGAFLYSSSEDSHNLGEDYTNQVGKFQVVSLKSSTNILHINRPDNFYFDDNEGIITEYIEPTSLGFTSIDFVNVSGSMDLGELQLHRKATFNLKIAKVTTNNDSLKWQFSYTHASCYYFFENGILLEEESTCYENFADNYPQLQDISDPYFENTYQTIIGGTATFTYQINNETEQVIEFNIDEPQENYVFEF